MPYSKDTFDDKVRELIRTQKPNQVLDIGAGSGKYGRMILELGSPAWTTAVEPDEAYISRFQLKLAYNRIYPSTGQLFTNPRERWDLVIMGDVIEHMRKSEGVDLLNFLVYRSKYILVIYPWKYIQDDWFDESGICHPQEAHISTWSDLDFVGWEFDYDFKDGMCWFLIKGYQA